jgi:membrane protease subunit HflC
MRRWIALGVAVAALLWLASTSLYIVSEGQQALVVRLGAPIAVEAKPGLKVKAPLIDSVFVYDTRLLLLLPPPEQVIMGDQKRLEAQPYARYRIVDPLRFYQALRTDEQARAQLAQIVSSSMRRALGQAPLVNLLTPDRARILQSVHDEVAAKARPLGVEIDEIRFHRADLPFETSQAIYDRMKSERLREAKELRAQGFEWAQQVQAKADRERTGILSEAQGAATALRGQGDAEASRLLSDAFGQDANFYQFYRSLQTYKRTLADSGATMMLTPASAFLKLLITGPETSPPAPAPTGEPK